jgi:hypothetical protein
LPSKEMCSPNSHTPATHAATGSTTATIGSDMFKLPDCRDEPVPYRRAAAGRTALYGLRFDVSGHYSPGFRASAGEKHRAQSR